MPVGFTIDAAVSARFPALRVHALRARGLRASLEGLDSAAALEAAVAGLDKAAFEAAPLAEHPAVESWREAYGRMAVKPSKFRSSIEALLRRALKGDGLAIPVPAVNLYNAHSIGGPAPMGAYDVAKLPIKSGAEDIVMRLADPAADRFAPLGGEASSFPLNPDLVIYALGNAVLCWGFNSRDSRETALDAESDDVVFFSEAVRDDQAAASAGAIAALRARLVERGADCSQIAKAEAAAPRFTLA